MAFGDMNRIEPGTAQSLQHSIKLLRITRGQGFEREPEYVCRTLYRCAHRAAIHGACLDQQHRYLHAPGCCTLQSVVERLTRIMARFDPLQPCALKQGTFAPVLGMRKNSVTPSVLSTASNVPMPAEVRSRQTRQATNVTRDMPMLAL